MTSLPKEFGRDRSFRSFDLMLPMNSSSVSLLSTSSLSNMDDSSTLSVSVTDRRRRKSRRRRSTATTTTTRSFHDHSGSTNRWQGSCGGGGESQFRRSTGSADTATSRWQGSCCGESQFRRSTGSSDTTTANMTGSTGTRSTTSSLLLRAPRRKPSNPFLSSAAATVEQRQQKLRNRCNYQHGGGGGLVIPTRKQSIPDLVLGLWKQQQPEQHHKATNLRHNVTFPRRKGSVTNLANATTGSDDKIRIQSRKQIIQGASSGGDDAGIITASTTTATSASSPLARQLLSCPFPMPTILKPHPQKVLGSAGTTTVGGGSASPSATNKTTSLPFPTRKESHMELSYHPASPTPTTAIRNY